MSDLKNCPFCGSSVSMSKTPLWNGTHGYRDCYEYTIACKECGCTLRYRGNNTINSTPAEAEANVVEMWNRREV